MMLSWTDVVVGPSALGPAVFTVAPRFREHVRDWAAAQDVAFAARHDVHWPAVEGWAVLDGGVTTISGYGLTSLPHGVRVLGFAAVRLLLADLGAEAPAEPFPGEVLADIDELRRRHQATRKDAPENVEQAELLAVCRDAELLRWVAAAFYEEAARLRTPTDQPAEPTPRPTPHNPAAWRRRAHSSPVIG